MLKIIRMVVGMQATNCYILYDEDSKFGLIIDPGGHGEAILNTVKEEGLKIEAILLTHAHGDHIGALNQVRDELGVEVYMAKEEELVYEKDSINMAKMMGMEAPSQPVDKYIKDGEVLDFKLGQIKALLTPGHTPGSMCFLIGDVLFSGDTLFQYSIGRTDFPGGSYPDMAQSLKRLMTLEDHIQVLSGHGEPTTIGIERSANPFINAL